MSQSGQPSADDTEPELHPKEQRIQDSIPREVHDDRDVLPERRLDGSRKIVFSDGEFLNEFERGGRKLERGRAELLAALLPITIHTERRGDVEVSQGDSFYYEPEGVRIRLYEADINREGRIYLTFKEPASSYPRRSWTFQTFDLARGIEAGDLRHDRELDERARATLDEIRGEH